MSDQGVTDIVRCQRFGGARRIVVKIGSAVLDENGTFDRVTFASLVRDLVELKSVGLEIIVVSSGAVALGMQCMGRTRRSDNLAELQALAAVGQGRLMRMWDDELGAYGVRCAQILLTHSVLDIRKRYLTARNAMRVVLAMGAVPIVNENDTVAIDEIKLGDNDLLSALTVNLVGAEFLTILTDIDGLYDGDPKGYDARRYDFVGHVDDRLEALAAGTRSTVGTGGMRTKLQAVRQVNHFGVPAVIAGGKTPRILRRLYAGEWVGTWFASDETRIPSRKHWIAYAARANGTLHVDAGAVQAITADGRSLLPIGVVAVDGAFDVGDAVQVCGPDGGAVARGLVGYGSSAIRRVFGLRSDEVRALLGVSNAEVIHRDDLVCLPSDRDPPGP